MRFKKVVLPAVVACAAVVAVPSSAGAGSEQCTLVMPTKVVVDSRSERIPVRLGTNCARSGAVAAYWDVEHSSGEYWEAYFEDGVTEGDLIQADSDAMGRYVGTRLGAFTAGDVELTQNQPVMSVKFASRLDTVVTRTSTKLTWAVTAKQWSGRAHAYYPRTVNVGLFYQATGSTTWQYVKSALTTSTGKATITLNYPKAGYYRLAVNETPTVWASYSRPIRGQI